MSDTATQSPERVFVDVLIDAPRVDDAVLSEKVARAFGLLGLRPVRRLVLEAARRKNRVPHRLRILAVVERIGQLSCADDWLLLTALAADPDEQIRAVAGRCLAACPVSNA